jgi:hypothetical protein
MTCQTLRLGLLGASYIAVTLQNLPWASPAQARIYGIDEKHDFEIIRRDKVEAKETTLKLDLAAPCVRFVVLSP